MDQSSEVKHSSRSAQRDDGKSGSEQADPRRGLPGVDRLAREMAGQAPDLPDWSLRDGARQAVAEARTAVSRVDARV